MSLASGATRRCRRGPACRGFDGATGWLNSPPLTAEGLRGKVVLVDFWTYTCINWLRTLAYVRAWAEKYQDRGLVVVGVHTPEFPFEHDVDNVRRAARRHGRRVPDRARQRLRGLARVQQPYWPAVYIADARRTDPAPPVRRGRLRRAANGSSSSCCARPEPTASPTSSSPSTPDGFEAQADWANLRLAGDVPRLRAGPELRVSRRRRSASRSTYAARDAEAQPVGARRATGRSRAERACSNGADGRIAFRFHARDVHLVMGPREPRRVGAVPRAPRRRASRRRARARRRRAGQRDAVAEQRLYQLIRQPGPIADRTFEITFLDGRRRGLLLHVRLAHKGLHRSRRLGGGPDPLPPGRWSFSRP